MALLFRGKTQCSLCNNIIQPEDDVVASPAFVSNSVTPTITPQLNEAITPQLNEAIIPQLNEAITPQLNEEITPQLNEAIAIDPKCRAAH